MNAEKKISPLVGRLLTEAESMMVAGAYGYTYSQSFGPYYQTSGNHNQTGDGGYTQIVTQPR